MKPLLFVCSIALAIGAFIPFAYYLRDTPSRISYLIERNAPLFINGKLNLEPEPGERLTFLSGIFFLPVISMGIYFILRKFINKRKKLNRFSANPNINFFAAQIVLTAVLILGYHIVTELYRTKEFYFYVLLYPSGYYIFIIVLVGLLMAFKSVFINLNSKIFLILGMSMIILSSLYSLMPENYFYQDWSTAHHFDQVYNLVIQAVHGNTSLVDFVSQYGVIYPHVVELFLKFLPFNFFTVSLFFVILIILSFTFFYLAIGEKSGNKSLYSLFFILGILGIYQQVYNSFNWGNGNGGVYYQYLPIRVIYGAFFMNLVLTYLKKETKVKYVLGFLVSALSVLWNADTGIVIWGSWICLLIYNTISEYRLNIKSVFYGLQHIFMGLVFLILLAVLYSSFAYIRSGHLPDWTGLFYFQQLYYLTGYWMVHMQPVGIWYLPAGIYLLTLVYCLVRLINNEVDRWTRFYFYFSVYGIGIFAYFQGRSVLPNVIGVIYPAVLLAGFHLYDFLKNYDFSLRNLKNTLSKADFHWRLIGVIPMTILLSHGFLTVIFYSYPIISKLINHWTVTPEVTVLSEQIRNRSDFISKNKKSDKIMIIAEDASYLHMNTNTYSSLPYGFYLEVATKLQANGLKELVRSDKVSQVFIDKNWGVGTADILTGYLINGETDQAYLSKFTVLP